MRTFQQKGKKSRPENLISHAKPKAIRNKIFTTKPWRPWERSWSFESLKFNMSPTSFGIFICPHARCKRNRVVWKVLMNDERYLWLAPSSAFCVWCPLRKQCSVWFRRGLFLWSLWRAFYPTDLTSLFLQGCIPSTEGCVMIETACHRLDWRMGFVEWDWIKKKHQPWKRPNHWDMFTCSCCCCCCCCCCCFQTWHSYWRFFWWSIMVGIR